VSRVLNRTLIVGLLAGMLWIPSSAFADPLPEGSVGSHVSVVGYNNLDDRPAFKMSIVQSGDHWYLRVS